MCSAAQELTAVQLGHLLPHRNLGMHCLKQILDVSVLYPDLIIPCIIFKAPARPIVERCTMSSKSGLWTLLLSCCACENFCSCVLVVHYL